MVEILETFGNDVGYRTRLKEGVTEIPDSFVAMMRIALG